MLYLLKPGELMLKKGNRHYFEQALCRNIRQYLPKCKVQNRTGRFYVSGKHSQACFAERLANLSGITGFAPVYPCPKDDESIAVLVRQLAAVQVAQYGAHSTFRICVRRTDKSLSKDSQGYAMWLGSVVLEQFPSLKVKLKDPDWSLKLELREKAYLYHNESKGLGGLPVGTSGRGMLLLSGGIDSPVAGYLMACRGLYLEAVYFDTPPFTTDEAYSKVQRLSARLARWTSSGQADTVNILLHRVPFTELQLALRKHVAPAALTLQGRACMVLLADRLANQRDCQALISGEALSQVSSQTVENLGYTNSFSGLPVLRPLIGFEKEKIIRLSRQLDCFDISIEPHVDCCSYFALEHPETQAKAPERKEELRQVPLLEELLDKALADIETIAITPHWANAIELV